MAYRHEWVRCGKTNCRSCPHGPYWYHYWREGKKIRKEYVGKRLFSEDEDRRGGEPTRPERPHRHDAIFSDRTASITIACDILGLGGGETKAQAMRIYRQMCKDHHPDRGGDERVFQRINVAWSYLNRMYGW
jgi:hypothetical protein